MINTGNGVIVWDANTKSVQAFLNAVTNVFDARPSADETIIAYGIRSGLMLWSPASGQVKDLTRVTPPVYRIAWVLGGSALVLADYDGGLYLFDMAAQCVTHVFSAPLGMVGLNLVRQMVPAGYDGPRRPQRASLR